MLNLTRAVLFAGLAFIKTRRQLAVENLALRHPCSDYGVAQQSRTKGPSPPSKC